MSAWLNFGMDGRHIDITGRKADLPLVMTYKARDSVLNKGTKPKQSLTVILHMPCIRNHFELVALLC
jgi:hypothetical protein